VKAAVHGGQVLITKDEVDPASRRTRAGRDMLTVASPAAGRDFSDDGRVHEARGLKGRPRQAAARLATRNVPIPPELVALLRDRIERFGTGEDGRLFRSANGNPIQSCTWWQVWRKVRRLALTPEQFATPLMRRRYDLRRSGITWRLNPGVPATEIAAWAGHSVEMLMRVYARCVAGLQDVWIARMEATLPDSLARETSQVTWYEHSCAFIDARWPRHAGKGRISLAEGLSVVAPILVKSLRGAADPAVLRHALRRWAFNPSRRSAAMPAEVEAALAGP